MKTPRRVPGLLPAIGAFVLTVLLGVGGASASALWQQSSTATMTVTANGTWAGEAITSLTCANDSPQKVATLSVTVPKAPAKLTYSALQPNGSYGPVYAGPDISSAAKSGVITLTADSQIIRDNAQTSRLTVRVTATYSDQTQATAEMILGYETGNSSGKIYCP